MGLNVSHGLRPKQHRVEGEAETVAQLGSNYGNVGFVRGNSFVLSLGPRWTIMVLVCLLVIAASVTVVFVRNAPSTSSAPEQWATWEHSKDGAQASEAAFTVTAQGSEATSNVVITGVRVKILEERPPLRGTLLYRQCGGPVIARTSESDCTWVIEFDWSTEGRSGVQTVTNNGQPFRTTSKADAAPCPLSRCP